MFTVARQFLIGLDNSFNAEVSIWSVLTYVSKGYITALEKTPGVRMRISPHTSQRTSKGIFERRQGLLHGHARR